MKKECEKSQEALRSDIEVKIKEQKEELQIEKEKSDKLLLNILPKKVAEDLKETGKTEPKLYDNVTVFYSDIVDFTEKTLQIPTDILLNELNDILF